VEIDRVTEVLFVAKAASRALHPLNLSVDGFAGRVGDAVLEVGDDVFEATLEHGGDVRGTRPDQGIGVRIAPLFSGVARGLLDTLPGSGVLFLRALS